MVTFSGADDYTTLPDDFWEDEHVVELESMNDPVDLNNGNVSQNKSCQPFNSGYYGGPVEPCEGMIFDELEEAEACYKAYARRKGFSIRKSHTRLSSKDKSLLGVDFSCNREGYHRSSYEKKNKNARKRSRTMIGCKAMLRLKRDNGTRSTLSPTNLVGSNIEDMIQGSSWTPLNVTQSACNMHQNFRPSTFMGLVMEATQEHAGTSIKHGYFSHFDSCRKDGVNPLN